MITPLLDPNLIPLVRAPERRAGDPAPRAFEHAVAATLPDAGVASAPVEVDLQDEQGAIRTIALPWGLAANPRLSQQVPGATAQTALFLMLQPGAAPAAPGESGQAAGIQPPGIAPAPAMTMPASASLPLPLLGLRDTARSSERPASTTSAALQADTGVPWQERWLQWLRGSGGDLQVRLRDYRLDDADHPKLLEQLHLFARDQGLALTRVSVNGHELWRAPDPATGNHHGR
jgi:hypothetical protein